jgi:hypothetical protein
MRPGGQPPGRRAFLKGALVMGASGALPGLAACSNERARPRARPSAYSPQPAPSHELLVYFSRAGENYHYGGRRDLQVGNTEVVANMVAQLADVDVCRLQPAEPYPHDYDRRSSATGRSSAMTHAPRSSSRHRRSARTAPCCSAPRSGTAACP